MFSKAGEFKAILHLVGLFPLDHQLPDNHNSVSLLISTKQNLKQTTYYFVLFFRENKLMFHVNHLLGIQFTGNDKTTVDSRYLELAYLE